MPSEDEERENTEATMDYMFPVALASALYARATGTAARHLREDIATILSTYTAKGGFADQREAREYMAGYIEPKDRAVLIGAARRLDEPWRTQELTRLSSAAYNWRITRKEAVDRAQRLAAKRLQQSAEEAVRRAAGRTVQAASRRTAYSVSREVGVAIRWDMPNERAIEQVVRGTGVYDLVKLYSVEQMKGVREIVTAGMLSGRRPEDIARDVSGYTATERWKSRRLVRTTIAQAAVDAEERELRELGIEEYEVACTLDERLCPICRRYDGKRYRFDDPKAIRPTFHPNCRCRIRQVIPQQYRAALRRSARDSEGRTATVPYDMGYDTWERIYGTERKQERLAMVDPPMRRHNRPSPVSKPKTEKKEEKDKEDKESERDMSKYYPPKVAEVERGEDMDFDKANGLRGNPNYSKGEPYRNNCQTCVVANEMRRRGYDVEAEGYSEENKTQRMLATFTNDAWLDPETGDRPWHTPVEASNPKKMREWLESNLVTGGRYTLEWGWRRSRSGHIVTVSKNDKGKIRLYDPQSGEIIEDDKELESLFSEVSIKSKYNKPKVLRVDTMNVNLEVVNKILKKHEGSE